MDVNLLFTAKPNYNQDIEPIFLASNNYPTSEIIFIKLIIRESKNKVFLHKLNN